MCAGREMGVSYRTSHAFREATNAILLLKDSAMLQSKMTDTSDLESRVEKLRRAANLGRCLEVDHGFSHSHKLADLIRKASDCGKFSQEAIQEMKNIQL